MLSTFDISLSGIKAATKLLDVSSNNVANGNTDNFKKDIAKVLEGDNGGVTVKTEKSTEPGPSYISSDGDIHEGSNVDYAEEIVNQIKAEELLRSNIAALNTANEIEDHIIDIFAWLFLTYILIGYLFRL